MNRSILFLIIFFNLINLHAQKEIKKDSLEITNGTFLKEHENFLADYRSQNWEKALIHIDKYRLSQPKFTLYYTLFLDRINELSKKQLPENWSGVFIAETK